MELKLKNGLKIKDVGNFDKKYLINFIQNMHSEYFERIGVRKKRKRELALVLFYYNVLQLYLYLLNYGKNYGFEAYIQAMKTCDYIFQNKIFEDSLFFSFLRTNTGTYGWFVYESKDIKEFISSKIFSEIIDDCLIKENIVKYTSGYHDKTDKNNSFLGKYFVDFFRIEKEIRCESNYENFEDTIKYIEKLLGIKKSKKSKPKNIFVEIRKNKSKRNDSINDSDDKIVVYESTNIDRYSNKNQKIIEESLEFCRLQKKIYLENSISIQDFNLASKEKQKISLEIYKSKKEFRKKLVDSELIGYFSNSIKAKNLHIQFLKENYKFKRIFHWFDKKSDFCYFGRFFSGCLDSLEREYKSLLLINGQETISFDLVSSITQLSAILSGENTQGIDFYSIDKLLDSGLSRNEIKHGFMLLQNCSNESDILGSCYKDHLINLRDSFKNKFFQCCVYEKFPYLKYFHLDKKENLKVMFHESELMREVISELFIRHNIVSFYNFDALFVSKSIDVEFLVSSVFESVSLKLFGSPIFLKID